MKTDYKKSQYNYISSSDRGHLIYNTLYNSLTRIDEEEYRQYVSLKFDSEQLLTALVKQGIIVRSDIDEIALYNICTFLAAKFQKSRPNITVTPTMECNARCFYCYEEGVRYGCMKQQDAEKIVDFIKKLDISRGINLTWFGGEPLMNQAWMDHFSDCLRAGQIAFSASIISNGSKIDDDVIVKMKESWNIKCIQITFDGICDEYSRRKSYIDQGENIYYQMLRKITKLTKAGISVQIRLNIDRDNIESILELVGDIQQLFAADKKVTCYPAFLTGGNNPLTEQEKITVVKRILQQDVYKKVPVDSYLYKLPKIAACNYYQKNAFSIDVNGDIFICERMLGHKNKAIGNIADEKDFPLVERELSGKRAECQMCVFLPKCQGGCTHALANGEMPCFIDKYIIKAYMEIL